MLSTKQLTMGSLLFVTFSISVYYITKNSIKKNKEVDDEEEKKEE